MNTREPLPPLAQPASTDPASSDNSAGRAPPGRAAAPRWATAGAVAAAALEACGGGSDDSSVAAAGVTPASARSLDANIPDAGLAAVRNTRLAGGADGPLGQSRTYAVPQTDSEAARFLLHCQFNASDADIDLVRSLGYAGYLAQQFDTIPASTAWTWLNQRGYGAIDGNLYANTPYQFDFAVWYQIFTSRDNVRRRVALALSEIFSVSINGIDCSWPSHVMANWWDALSSGGLGTFRALLERVSLHPAMGVYLNSRGSQKSNASGRQPDENFAREVMQLMTIGLVKLNPDGTPVSSGGVPLDSYTQDDVVNLARVFTGYDFDFSGNVTIPFNGKAYPSTTFTRLPMALNPALHSTLEVNFLGTNIPAGTEGAAARKIALDTLANHPNVGPFIGRQLIQRLVTSNPSPAYVGRVAAAFGDNGRGVRGDLAATVAAVLLDDEARGPEGLSNPTFGRLREPMVRLAQWGRTFNLNSARGSWKVYDKSGPTQLGQSPLRAPSIFNFFRPGYVPPATAISAAGLFAPEFQQVTESTVSAYLNYMLSTLRNGMAVGAPNLPQITNNASDGFDLTPDYASELQLVHDPAAMVARFNLLMAAGQLSDDTVSLIVNALKATPITQDGPLDRKLNRVASGLLMVMSSSEYLVQK